MTCAVCLDASEAWLLPGAKYAGRLRDWFFDELVPRDGDNIALCRACQFGVMGARGFVPFLIQVVFALSVVRGAEALEAKLTTAARRYAREHQWVNP